jgi:chromosome segregation ATPase
LNQKVQGLERDKAKSDGIADNIRKDFEGTQARMDELKHNLAETQLELDTCKKDISQNKTNGQKLRSDLEQTNSNIADVRDDHAKTGLLAQNTAKGLSQTDNNVRHLQNMLQNRVQPDIEKLREGQTQNEYASKQLKQMINKTNSDVKDLLEDLRSTQTMARGIVDNLAKTDANLDKLGNREADLEKKLQETQQNLDGTRTGLMKLQDNQVRTAAAVADLQQGMQRLNDEAKRHSDHLGHHSRHLDTKEYQLDTACGDLNKARDDLRRLEAAMQKMKSSQELMAEKNRQIAVQLDQTDQIARETKKGLSQTNSVVLPNLAMDPHVSRGTDFSRATPRSSPATTMKGQKDLTMKPGSLSQRGNMILSG